MKIFTCKCRWKYVIGKKKFYGPIFEDGDARCARIQPLAEFREGYADCWARFQKSH